MSLLSVYFAEMSGNHNQSFERAIEIVEAVVGSKRMH